SNSLDEHIINDVLNQGAQIDVFGVGERLITAKSEPVFGGVYKLVAIENDGKITPRIKISENMEKITNPHFKKVYRIFSKEDDKALADLICEHDEVIDESRQLIIFDPIFTWKKKVLTNFYVRPLHVQIFKKGQQVYESPTVLEIRDYARIEVERLWPEVLRLENPHNYYVDLSEKLWNTRQELLLGHSSEIVPEIAQS
ncbi:MAG TPA: nicotinate phosphoribosyltransferase, partial [Clostridiaceae bacterium]|nr:nicotinate phosphoribosyltransferase [Clostridiaceae bacterium]